MNSVNETLIGGGGINEASLEAARPGLMDECQKSCGCETGECKVILDKCISYFKS